MRSDLIVFPSMVPIAIAIAGEYSGSRLQECKGNADLFDRSGAADLQAVAVFPPRTYFGLVH